MNEAVLPIRVKEQPGRLHYNSGFPHDEEAIARVAQKAIDPAFLATHPDQRVFILPSGEVLGTLPMNEKTEGFSYPTPIATASRALQEEAQRRGVDLHSCAIITTGELKPTYKYI